MPRIKRLWHSFQFAFSGLGSLIRKEQSFRIHLIAAVAVVALGAYLQIKLWQWCLIILMIALVLILEMLNTVFERLADMLKPRLHHYVKEIKDILSAVVLVVAVASALIALLIFVPYFWS